MTEDEKKERRVKNLMMFLVVLHQEHDNLETALEEKGTSKAESNYYNNALHYLNSRIEHYRGIIKSIK